MGKDKEGGELKKLILYFSPNKELIETAKKTKGKKGEVDKFTIKLKDDMFGKKLTIHVAKDFISDGRAREVFTSFDVDIPQKDQIPEPEPPKLKAKVSQKQIAVDNTENDVTVTLDGSPSTGDITGYEWTSVIISGQPTIPIENRLQAITQAIIPKGQEFKKIAFELTVKDENANTDTETVEIIPKGTGPGPGPQPEGRPTIGKLLYDMNTDIDWTSMNGKILKVTDTYGDQSSHGKGFHMQASGNPRMYLDPTTREMTLEHDGKYGRGYFHVPNYESLLTTYFMLDKETSGASFKTRNRHQYKDQVGGNPPIKDMQGGQGCGIHYDEVDCDLEISHGVGEVSGPNVKLSPTLGINEWHKLQFWQYDKDGQIHVIVEINDKVVAEGDVKAPAQFFDKAKFEEWSEFWVRLNADQGGQLKIKDLKMYELTH